MSHEIGNVRGWTSASLGSGGNRAGLALTAGVAAPAARAAAGAGGPGLRPGKRGRGRESGSEREGSGGAASHGPRAAPRAAQRQREPGPWFCGGRLRRGARGRAWSDLWNPFGGSWGRGCGRGDRKPLASAILRQVMYAGTGRERAGAVPPPPCPPGTRLCGTRACRGADISHQALATGCPRAPLPPCHKNKPLISFARCVPSREVAAVRTGTICPAIPGDADIFL